MANRTKSFDNNKDEKWYLVDAKEQILGRLASKVAYLLIGKNRVTYSPDRIGGNYVVVINTDKVKVTGKKLIQKKYYRHSGHLGNLKEFNLKYMLEKDSTKVLEMAVSKMLPKNKLRKRLLKRLKLYRNSEHKHSNHNLIQVVI
ncbi:MAG: 50S ribosomal protein L13 [bacterium]